MKFIILKLPLVWAIMLALISAPACAITITAVTGDGSGVTSVSGEYRLQDSVALDSKITLSEGMVSRQSSASGSGKNSINERTSGSDKSITNAITSDGSFSIKSGDIAFSAGAVSNYQTSLAGSSGSISTVSTGEENQMTIAGGFSGQGNMDVSLSSLASGEALTTGTASALGTSILSDELVQGISGQDMAVSVQGLYQAGQKNLGEFGMVAQNAKGGAATKPQPIAATYKLAGWRWKTVTDGVNEGPFIPISVSQNNLPAGIFYDNVASEIATTTGTWDAESSEVLFNPVNSGESTYSFASWKTRDNKNVHQWTSDTGLSDNTIAMTVTWSTRAKIVPGDDGKLYSQAVESDCWYNNRLTWHTNDPSVGEFDIRTIALHEIGHTLGLSDLYEDSNKYQTMYGYNDGTADWTLNSTGDVIGLQKLYGS